MREKATEQKSGGLTRWEGSSLKKLGPRLYDAQMATCDKANDWQRREKGGGRGGVWDVHVRQRAVFHVPPFKSGDFFAQKNIDHCVQKKGTRSSGRFFFILSLSCLYHPQQLFPSPGHNSDRDKMVSRAHESSNQTPLPLQTVMSDD